GSNPLHLAARTGRLSLVLLYLSLGVEVDLRGENGWTPLHEAMSQGDKVVVRALIGRGASLQAKTRTGHT
ncbi:ankyrin repeat-containing domain protein, partial [Piptocephalis cylindrospora]